MKLNQLIFGLLRKRQRLFPNFFGVVPYIDPNGFGDQDSLHLK